MSHELRTPLTAVLGFADLMSRDPSIPGRSRDNLAIIIRSGEHLLTLINDILDLSKIEAGRIEVDRRDVDLGELIQDIMNMMRVRAEAKGLRLVLDQSSEFPRFVHSDPGKFRQILVNLMGNAIKFTSAGQIMLKLTAAAIPDGHLLAVEVRDTGIGIAPGDMDRIFRPFEQIMTRMTEGSGLGLTITRQYVQMLGGQISVTSELGKGTCFSFTIPVGLVSLDKAQALPVARHPARISSPTADLRLLIVEDQDENRLLLRCFLEPFNFQLREAVNGEEAIAIFQDWHPQLIFMDRRMPVLDGLSATRQIRSLPGGAQTIIVAVSAHSFNEEQQEMLAAGCNGFIAKPFGAADLLALLKQHLHLDFTYTEDEAPEEAARPLSATDLASLSPDALAVLNRLAIVCDESELVKWLESQDGLAPVVKKKLAHLIQEYQFEAIQTISAALLRQA
jgi:CheY-like chemotaxis protein